ncbi:acid protease [Coniophora puteana RWD-64-598 SS2]|uniref:Acid protease n=1 Tax=Coniophora puteana (strain RWD-64-598) TaxID=741705 RepID=R7SEQ2_CONPW|nr:acid protease [Coniophora puteana RWD-64-598 SS2]EIW74658.1 acid protease [Coniophora puteana RWD-64-598 SS2]
MKPSSFLPFGLGLANAVGATRLSMSGRRSDVDPYNLQRRTSIGGNMNVTSASNLQYVINSTLGGEAISIMIDTGSSDFVCSKKINNATDQKYNESVSYAGGSALGEVYSATLHFADYVIPDQFYIYDSSSDAFGSLDGLVGLGPSAGSAVRTGGPNNSKADPPVDRIFLMDNSTDNYITILLSRSDDPDEPYPGELTVSEAIPDHAAILNQTKLEIAQVALDLQHWQVYLDEDGIKGPDGQRISIKSNVTDSKYPKNASVVFDTGFSLPQVPGYVAEAFYGNVSGASMQNISGLGNVWVLPCDVELSVSFFFAGVEFPIHPLDLNFDSLGTQSENDTEYCVGAFQPFSFDQEEAGVVPYDMILGMAFLRNAYMLINFGDYIDVDTPKDGAAYIQLLPLTTNTTEASADFKKERQQQNEDDSSPTDKAKNEVTDLWNKVTGHTGSLSTAAVGGIIAGVAAVALALVGGLIFCCMRRRRGSKSASSSAAAGASYAQWMPGYGNSYRGLNEATPAGADDMRIHSAAQPGSQQQYSTAWDHHH